MKKLPEDEMSVRSTFFEDDQDDLEFEKVRAFYDHLTGCDKNFVYRDSKNWYIRIS